MKLTGCKIAIIGLGYVGLPLAVEFGKRYTTVGFDISSSRIKALKDGEDSTLELSFDEIKASTNLILSHCDSDLKDCNVYVVTVPTPIDQHNQPDLRPLLSASRIVAKNLDVGDIVIYESTVYPGATEEECVPVLARGSGLTYNSDFFVGYSPERINPGDKDHTITTIMKITSGSNAEVSTFVDSLYQSIITAGTYKATSIKVAEAAKVIENTQRDVNIGLINELALIFNKLDIDTEEVLKAAGTKWNFLPFRPGLVGGHCIGVDPYYLTFKAESVGYRPEIILAGRRLNDGMGVYVANRLVKAMLKRRIHINGSKVLILGLTFKENCPDIRNSKVFSIAEELREYGVLVHCFDPLVNKCDWPDRTRIEMLKKPLDKYYDGIILAVAHDNFRSLSPNEIRKFGNDNHLLFDIKNILSIDQSDLRL